MNLDKIKGILIKHEGRKNKPYLCTKGKETIGIGWNITANSLPLAIRQYLETEKEITDIMIDELFYTSVMWATRDCKKLYYNFKDFSENRQHALIDFLFQLGYSKAKKFERTNKLINENRWSAAADEILNSDYAKDTPARALWVSSQLRDG